MKKIFALLLVAGAFTLTACGNKEAATEAPAADSTAMAPAPADTTMKADSTAAPAAAAPAAAPAAH